MKNVLIALDFGTSSKKIAKKGYELAQKMNAKVILLHAVASEDYYGVLDSQPFMSYYGIDLFNMVEAGDLAEPTLKYLDKIKKHLGDDSIETIALHGNFADIILETAKREKADIIVIGSHSHNWIEKTIMGSVTQSVLDKSEIPLYIIPVWEH